MFHWMMHKAINIVHRETQCDDQPAQICCTSLQQCCTSNFTGEDTFLEVMDNLGNSVITIADHIQCCLEISFH